MAPTTRGAHKAGGGTAGPSGRSGRPVVGTRATRSSGRGPQQAAKYSKTAPAQRPRRGLYLPPRNTRSSAKEDAVADANLNPAPATANAAEALADLEQAEAPPAARAESAVVTQQCASPTRASTRAKRRHDYRQMHEGTPPAATQTPAGRQASTREGRAELLRQAMELSESDDNDFSSREFLRRGRLCVLQCRAFSVRLSGLRSTYAET